MTLKQKNKKECGMETSKIIEYVPLTSIVTVKESKKAGFWPKKKQNYRLMLDCTHNPPSLSYDSGWIVARDFKKAVQLIKLYGFPSHIKFGVIHHEDRKMSDFTKNMFKWAINTKQHFLNIPTFSFTASISPMEQGRIKKQYDLFIKQVFPSNHTFVKVINK